MLYRAKLRRSSAASGRRGSLIAEVFLPVPDEGGRQTLQSLILDVQSTVRGFDERTQASVERALAETDTRLSVCSAALAIPTEGPLDSFIARTYPACYVEWWFGDGAPGLE